jgi:succinate dehydrogenase / fumarate reductase iron-sulfur subunit
LSTQVPETETESETTEESSESASQQRRLAEKTDREETAREDAAATPRAEIEEETFVLTVFRYDPEVEAKAEPRYDDFHVPRRKGMTVLDALIYARDHYDSTLTFRHSCRQAICGSDAFFVNGSQRLGCQTQIADLGEPVRVEPLPHQEVLKDLVVDMEHFYDGMAAVEPYFQDEDLPGARSSASPRKTARRSSSRRGVSGVARACPPATSLPATTTTSAPPRSTRPTGSPWTSGRART